MRGAFIVGALQTFYEKLGPSYFDAIFATSVGVFEQAFFASGQIFFMENTWREYVHGFQLINPFNPLRGRAILDLDYLVELFQSDRSRLDVEAMKASNLDLFTFITDAVTKEPVCINLKEHNVFEIMKATCALPVIYPKKIYIDGRRYVDSWLAPQQKFKATLVKALEGYDEVIGIVNYQNHDKELDRMLGCVLRPSHMPLKGVLDTHQDRIIATIEQGKKDALEFINKYGLEKRSVGAV